jgi:hypothetical protein
MFLKKSITGKTNLGLIVFFQKSPYRFKRRNLFQQNSNQGPFEMNLQLTGEKRRFVKFYPQDTHYPYFKKAKHSLPFHL